MTPVTKKLAFALGAVLLAVGAGFVLSRSDLPANPGALAPSIDPASGTSRVPIEPAADAARVERTVVDDAKPAPSPEHATRAGASLYGRVVGRGGIPLARAEVACTWRAPGGPRAVGRVQTAQDGTFALVLEELAALVANGHAIELDVRASAQGYVPARLRRTLGAGDVLVRLEPGSRLRGRAVDVTGRAVADAELALWHADANATTPLSSTTSSPDGRFELGFVSAGPHRLSARADRVGSALVEALALAAGGDRDLGDVVLRGAHSIAGRATHADGSPARGLELWAVSSEFGAHGTPQAFAARAAEFERGDGLASAGARTRDDGRFEFEGLRGGAFRIRSAEPEVVIRAPERVEAGARDVAIEVGTQRLLVRVVDAQGARAPGAQIACVELLEDGGSFESGRVRHAVARADGSASFAVEAATTYALVARFGKQRSGEDLAILAPGEGSAERTLRLESSGAEARLVVEALGPKGEKVPRLRVELCEPLSGRAREDLGTIELSDDGVSPPLGAGSYRVLVHQAEDPPSLYFPELVATPVVLAAGETRTLTVRMRAGARIELRLDADGASALDRDVDGVRCVLAREGSSDVHAQFFTGTQIVTALLPGESGVLTSLVEPGAWTLRATSGTFREVERSLSLAAGEVLRVELALRRE